VQLTVSRCLPAHPFEPPWHTHVQSCRQQQHSAAQPEVYATFLVCVCLCYTRIRQLAEGPHFQLVRGPSLQDCIGLFFKGARLASVAHGEGGSQLVGASVQTTTLAA